MKASWTRVPLGDAFSTVTGSTPSKSDSSLYGDFMPLVKPPELLDGPLDSAEDGLSKAGVQIARTLPAHSVLISCIGNLGKVGLNTIPVAFNQQINAVIPNRARALPQFIFYQALSEQFRDQLEALATGTTVRIVNKSKFNSILIVLPSLPEQQRIVAILDDAFEGIATAKANAEKNLQNARAIFESQLQFVFTKRGTGWVERLLKDVCEKITDGTHQTPKYFDNGIVFLSSRNVTSGTIDWNRVKYIDKKQHLEMHKRVAPRRDDILLAKNGTTGVAAIVDRDTTFDIYVSLALLRALPVIRPRFLLHFINSPPAKVQFNKRLKGIGVPNLHLEEIREVRLAFPEDLQAQDRVISELDHLRVEIQRLQTIYERKLAALDSLKNSLLHSAFAGELTAGKTSEMIEAVA